MDSGLAAEDPRIIKLNRKIRLLKKYKLSSIPDLDCPLTELKPEVCAVTSA